MLHCNRIFSLVWAYPSSSGGTLLSASTGEVDLSADLRARHGRLILIEDEEDQ